MIRLACQEKFIRGEPDLAGRARRLRRLGFDAVELRGKAVHADGGAQARAALAATRVPVSAVCMGYGGALLSDDADERARARLDILDLMRICVNLGGAGVVVVLAEARGLARPQLADEERNRLLERARVELDLLAGAAPAGGTALVECRNRYESPILRTLDEGAALLRDLGEPAALRLLADAFHMNIEEAAPARALLRHAPLIGYVHLADSNRRLPGHGHTDFRALLRALAAAGYDGYASLEAWDAGGPVSEEDLRASCALLREALPAAGGAATRSGG